MASNTYAGVSLDLPPGWYDVTLSLPEGSCPTLGKGKDGVGALQFSVARYESGTKPSLTGEVLQRMLADFFQTRGLVAPTDRRATAGEVLMVSGDYLDSSEFIRVWYVADGVNVALVTYCVVEAQEPEYRVELIEADSIARSIRF